jgi:hypothetical protein
LFTRYSMFVFLLACIYLNPHHVVCWYDVIILMQQYRIFE